MRPNSTKVHHKDGRVNGSLCHSTTVQTRIWWMPILQTTVLSYIPTRLLWRPSPVLKFSLSPHWTPGQLHTLLCSQTIFCLTPLHSCLGSQVSQVTLRGLKAAYKSNAILLPRLIWRHDDDEEAFIVIIQWNLDAILRVSPAKVLIWWMDGCTARTLKKERRKYIFCS